jgi:hypothetical protein
LNNQKPEARVFDTPSPDILGDVLPSMIGTVKMGGIGKDFANRFNQTLCLIRDNSDSLVVKARMKILGKLPELHPTLLVFIPKKNSQCNWRCISISSSTIT